MAYPENNPVSNIRIHPKLQDVYDARIKCLEHECRMDQVTYRVAFVSWLREWNLRWAQYPRWKQVQRELEEVLLMEPLFQKELEIMTNHIQIFTSWTRRFATSTITIPSSKEIVCTSHISSSHLLFSLHTYAIRSLSMITRRDFRISLP